MSNFSKRVRQLERWLFPSPAEKKFMRVMGWWFFFRYTVHREYRVKGYYIDFAVTPQHIAIEVDGKAFHGGKRDILKDMVLNDAGWLVYRIKAEDLWRRPKETRHYVRLFVKNPRAYIKKYG